MKTLNYVGEKEALELCRHARIGRCTLRRWRLEIAGLYVKLPHMPRGGRYCVAVLRSVLDGNMTASDRR